MGASVALRANADAEDHLCLTGLCQWELPPQTAAIVTWMEGLAEKLIIHIFMVCLLKHVFSHICAFESFTDNVSGFFFLYVVL